MLSCSTRNKFSKVHVSVPELSDDSIFKKDLLLHKKVKTVYTLAQNHARASRMTGRTPQKTDKSEISQDGRAV